MKQFKSLSFPDEHKASQKLYLTFGALEIEDDQKDLIRQFTQLLSKCDSIQLKTKIYKRLEHMGTAIPSFEDGIEYVLGN